MVRRGFGQIFKQNAEHYILTIFQCFQFLVNQSMVQILLQQLSQHVQLLKHASPQLQQQQH